LEKLEMVTRIKDEKDQRINRLRLTRNGQALYSKLKVIVEESLELIFEGVETEKKQQCIEVLESVLINIDAINQSKL
jgi:DNA-binding MarR family transcriptional regulator